MVKVVAVEAALLHPGDIEKLGCSVTPGKKQIRFGLDTSGLQVDIIAYLDP